MITQKSEEEIIGLISNEKYIELIPLNAGTANVMSFLNALSRTKSEKDIDDLFECTEGQAFEQLVNATQWPIDTKITMNNIETLKAMIIWDELICKREKQLNVIRDGLAYVEFLPLLRSHSELLSEYFLGDDKKNYSPVDDRGYPMGKRCVRSTKKSIGVFETVHRGKRFTNLDIFPEIFDRSQFHLFFK